MITGGAGDEIRVEAVKHANGHKADETKRQLEGVTIDASERAGRVEISTSYPHKQNSQVDVDYTVHVPAGAAVSVRSVSGNIELTGLKGEARLETVSGSVTTTNSRQLARVKSVSGDVSVSEGSSGDVLSLGTVSGNLTVRRLKARTLEVQTISGDLSLTDAVCDRVQAKTMSGDLQFGGPLAKAGRYEFNSHSGDVRLSLQGPSGSRSRPAPSAVTSDPTSSCRVAAAARRRCRRAMTTIAGTDRGGRTCAAPSAMAAPSSWSRPSAAIWS